MNQIKPYYNGVGFNNFPGLSAKIEHHYDMLFDSVVPFEITSRYIYEMGLKISFRDIFYYINLLYDNSPSSVIDVGCGECIWKNWFPNIIGFDPNQNQFSQQDFIDFFDKDFSKNHTRCYDSGMALNSIHFVPWDYIPTQIDLAMNIVKDKFLFTFNLEWFGNMPSKSHRELVEDLYGILENSQYNIFMFDYPVERNVDLHATKNWAFSNGDIRFILEHKLNCNNVSKTH
jgi:hypothetical protein